MKPWNKIRWQAANARKAQSIDFDFLAWWERQNAIEPLPAYVQMWLAATQAEPTAETFLREAEEWDANAEHAAAYDNTELAELSRSRAAAMREAAAIIDGRK